MRIDLTDDQKMGLEAIEEIVESRRRRFLEAVLVRNGGSLDELWQFNAQELAFFKNEPDETAAP